MTPTRRDCLIGPVAAWAFGAGRAVAAADCRVLRDGQGMIDDRLLAALAPGRYVARMSPANLFVLHDLLRHRRIVSDVRPGQIGFTIAAGAHG